MELLYVHHLLDMKGVAIANHLTALNLLTYTPQQLSGCPNTHHNAVSLYGKHFKVIGFGIHYSGSGKRNYAVLKEVPNETVVVGVTFVEECENIYIQLCVCTPITVYTYVWFTRVSVTSPSTCRYIYIFSRSSFHIHHTLPLY